MSDKETPNPRYTAIYLETELINRLETELNQVVLPQGGVVSFILNHVLDCSPQVKIIKALIENRPESINLNRYCDETAAQVSIVSKELAGKLHAMAVVAECSVPALIERMCASFVLLFELLDSNSMAEELKRVVQSSYTKIQSAGNKEWRL